MRYDTLTAFAPIGQIATASLLIVTRPDFPANNVKELVTAAKADPGKIVFASPGFAATQHFAGEMFKQTAQVNLLHAGSVVWDRCVHPFCGLADDRFWYSDQ